jgi:DNA polymerase elongation subunit (family B)
MSAQYVSCKLFGNIIYYIGYQDGKRVQFKEPISPSLYLKSNTPTDYKTLSGEFVSPKSFNTVKEAKDFIKEYEYVTDFKVYGYEKFNYIWLSEKFPEIIKFNNELVRKFYLDIETTSEYGFPNVNDPQESIICLTLYDSYTKIYNVYGIADITLEEVDTVYHQYSTEPDMLIGFLNYWKDNYPDVLSSWNGIKFDIPYIINRINLVLGESYSKKLSPWGRIHTKKDYDFGNEYTVYEIVGVSHLDYMQLYKKFTYKNQESYSLDHIANVELGAEKLDHSEYGSWISFYTENIFKFTSYNLQDVRLLRRLEEKMGLLDLALVVSYDAKINFSDVYSQVCCWDNIIYNYLKERNIVVPSKAYNTKDDKFDGAFVKEPNPGMYSWVVSFDLASLYPHIIQLLNISPETIRGFDPQITIEKVLNESLDFSRYTDYCISPSGTLYDRTSEGMLSQLMSKYYSERKHYKKLQKEAEKEYQINPTEQLAIDISTYNNIQLAKKIAMNSAYGVLGSPYFRYYNLANATSITHTGQVAIRCASDRINIFISELVGKSKDRIIANDTDSMFIDFNDLVLAKCEGMNNEQIVDYLDEYCQAIISPKISEIYDELGEYLHVYKQCLTMVRDTISSKFLITGKKRYISNVYDAEGVRYKEPKLKVVGLEVVRSSTPKCFRDKLNSAYSVIINSNNSELIEYVDRVRSDSKKLTSAEIGVARGVSDVNKYTDPYSNGYIKGTPIGARSAIVYNGYILVNNLEKKYQLIKNGDKIKTVYLKMPNPIHENIIAFFGSIPPEMGLEQYVDHDLMLEKCFLTPLEGVLNVVGWELTESNTLEDLLF